VEDVEGVEVLEGRTTVETLEGVEVLEAWTVPARS
jgi:hypothetical protein